MEIIVFVYISITIFAFCTYTHRVFFWLFLAKSGILMEFLKSGLWKVAGISVEFPHAVFKVLFRRKFIHKNVAQKQGGNLHPCIYSAPD